MKKQVEWNINYYVTVKLTEHGLDIFKEYEHQFDNIRGNKEQTKTKVAEIIANDYQLRLQGWNMMQIFGNHCYLGSLPIFHECSWKVEVEE